ncbi:MAG: hypothetical protein ABL889_20610 [Terricaulis sp.]
MSADAATLFIAFVLLGLARIFAAFEATLDDVLSFLRDIFLVPPGPIEQNESEPGTYWLRTVSAELTRCVVLGDLPKEIE